LHDAWLIYTEEPNEWTNGAGQPERKPGCVAALGKATTDWANAAGVPLMFQSELFDNAPPGRKEWNVKLQVTIMLNDPQNPSLHHGFVLQGGMSLDQLEGEDDTRCESKLSGIGLRVTWSPRS
jgi:hypothetical protein